MIKLYDFELSGSCYKVRLLLTQLGIPFERQEIRLRMSREAAAEFRKVNPLGRVPALELDTGEVLAESNAILCYFAEGTPFLPEDKLVAVPAQPLSAEEHVKNNLPDVLTRWQQRDGAECERPRTAQSFCVPRAEIAANGYDLSLNRYKEVVYEEVQHVPPKQILAELAELEREIEQGMKELEAMVR